MTKRPIIFLIISLIAMTAVSAGCGSGNGDLSDYFGWQSLGGTYRGTLHLDDSRTGPIAMTFTEFDGDSFHVKVEAGTGADYIRNEADAAYDWDTKSFTFHMPAFLGGPCDFQGAVVDDYNISGDLQVTKPNANLTGYYDITLTP